MNAWDRPITLVETAPFDHIVIDDFLPADMFAAMAESFPSCPKASGTTGYTIHVGDAAFDEVMARSPAWQAFWQACDGPAFISYALRQFSSTIQRQAVLDLSGARHVSYRESRADKAKDHLVNALAPDELWIRFDFMQARAGGMMAPHIDRRRRLVSTLLYFDHSEDGEGDLILHGRYGGGKRIATRPNRLVMLACTGASLHSVAQVTNPRRVRSVLQVLLSSSVDVWAPVRQPLPRRLFSIAGRVADQIGLGEPARRVSRAIGARQLAP